jgi:hypothetical protein
MRLKGKMHQIPHKEIEMRPFCKPHLNVRKRIDAETHCSCPHLDLDLQSERAKTDPDRLRQQSGRTVAELGHHPQA